MANKLFGNSSRSKFTEDRSTSQHSSSKHPFEKRKRTRSRLRPLKIILSIVLVLEILYCIAIFTNIPFIKTLRTMYIKTAMSTMNHQWLATALIPKDIVDEVVILGQQAQENQIGLNSSWEDVDKNPDSLVDPTNSTTPENNEPNDDPPVAMSQEQIDFFTLFWELDQKSMLAYVEDHPEVVANGWDKIYINEAGLDDEGTSIMTTMDEQVLAIDAENQILLIRVTGTNLLGTGYRGVLAVAKDPARLSIAMSKNIGSSGQRAGKIAEANGAILAMTASGFHDPDGAGNGGRITGGSMSNGKTYGHHFGRGYKRAELREDNRLYIVDAPTSYTEGTTDAAEFQPALIINGKNALGADNFYTEMNPRACIGQSRKGEILFLVVEGRFLDSLGVDAEGCVEILLRHDCYQAMNMDGGTSAIMWYNGEYVTRCSNTRLPEGRYLPNAWVYGASNE